MVKKYIILLFIVTIFNVSCIEDSIVEVRAEFTADEDIIVKTPKDIEDFYVLIFRQKLIKLTGIDKLKNLKRLKIVGLYGYTDYSFLTKLPEIEELFLEDPELSNFTFLKHMKKLKVFFLSSVHINKFEIDFKNNTELVSATFKNLHNINNDESFALKIKNIPESLRYLDLYLNRKIIFTEELLESIKDIAYVFLSPEIKKMFGDFFIDHSNFYFSVDDLREIIPVEYQYQAMSKKTEYRLYYFK